MDGDIASLPDGGIDAVAEARFAEGAPTPTVLCAHERLGGVIVGIAPESVTVTGSVAEREEWTEIALPESGAYVVPGALVPVEIDREREERLERIVLRERCLVLPER